MKPANIYLAELGGPFPTAKVLDFGSSIFGADESEQEDAPTELHTRVGTAVGTPQYMTPEQISGTRDFDPRIDVFACGAILYEALTGRRAFRGATLHQLFQRILTSTPDPPSSVIRGLPRRLDAILAKAMARDRGLRYPSAGAFSAALEPLLTSVPTPAVAWSPARGTTQATEALSHLQTRFRELAAMHHRVAIDSSSSEPPRRRTRSTLDIPIIYEEGSSSSSMPRLHADDDPEGTAPTKRRRRSGSRSSRG